MKRFKVEVISVKTKKTNVVIEANDIHEAREKALIYANETELVYRVPFYVDTFYNVINMPFEVDIYENQLKTK